MSDLTNKQLNQDRKSIIYLVISLIAVTLAYQLKPFLDPSEFKWIYISTYVGIPGILLAFSTILTIKLHKQKHFQSAAFLFFTIGVLFWFIAEQIFALFIYVYDIDPFPSIADIFYLGAYPFFVIFLFLSIKPIRKSITKNIWLFSFVLSFSFLIPSVLACYNALEEAEGGLDTFSKSIALSYPILSALQLAPAIASIMFLIKKEITYSWMLLLFGFLIYSISDTFYLFSELDGSYYDGHPVDVMYLFSFLLLVFSLYSRLNLANNSNANQTIFFTNSVKFETINKFGIPITLIIFSLIVIISLINATYISADNLFSVGYIVIGVVAMLVVFIAIILLMNRNITKFVTMRTKELEDQQNNLESLIKEKTQALLKAERFSAIGELSGRLAHDLRNPLSVMKMSLDLIKQHNADAKISDPVITKRLRLIEQSIERISHQVDDVLDYVRSSSLKLIKASLREIILGSLNKIVVPHNVTLTVSDSDIAVNCDTVKLDAVFINIIMNAIQAISEKEGTIEIKIRLENNYAIIDIIDSGIGIPEEFKDKIFEPLFTTKQQGTGLGLASCKNILEQHHGTISVKNHPTTFTIKFPTTLT